MRQPEVRPALNPTKSSINKLYSNLPSCLAMMPFDASMTDPLGDGLVQQLSVHRLG